MNAGVMLAGFSSRGSSRPRGDEDGAGPQFAIKGALLESSSPASPQCFTDRGHHADEIGEGKALQRNALRVSAHSTDLTVHVLSTVLDGVLALQAARFQWQVSHMLHFKHEPANHARMVCKGWTDGVRTSRR